MSSYIEAKLLEDHSDKNNWCFEEGARREL